MFNIMILPIKKYGAAVLRQKAQAIIPTEDIAPLAEQMFETLTKHNGLGLAAPQIGVSKRLFIIDTTPLAHEDPTIQKFQETVINPEIVEFSPQQELYYEGCLSIPGINEDVLRPTSIDVRYFDIHFNQIETRLHGIQARIFQHEFDHLNGMLFTDRLGTLKRKLLSGKLKKIQKQ